ncbi:hypothetical protein BpHYR1_017738 [Brachionus plicatilis]|uniref:Uncharacterized protein n=1 Tax=Brachionus plicatilis TaxID=10195 RepID=A0A3M7S6V9_BRAPC|nr:hypothetical protein BpHYR1_017738 [Brachionus plicatilis]
MHSLKNSSLSSSVSSASSASSSFKQTSPSQYEKSGKLHPEPFQATSFSYHTFNPNRISSYDNENLYEPVSTHYWPKHDTLSEQSREQFDNVKYCRKRASIACTNCDQKPKASLLSRAFTYSSKPGSNSSLSKNGSWRTKLAKYLSSTNSTNSTNSTKPKRHHDEDIYSSCHLARKNPIQLPLSSNTNILVSSSSSSSASSHMSSSPKAKNLTSSLQKLTISNGFNSLRKMLRIKSSSKQNLDCGNKLGSRAVKKQLSFNQNDSVLKLFGKKQHEPIFNSTRNDLSCFNSKCSCVDTSGSTLFNNILSSSPITIRNFDQPEVEAVPQAISCANVKMYDGYRSLIKQIDDLKLGKEEEEEEEEEEQKINEEDRKCDMEVASFFTRTIKCQAVNNFFSSNDLVNYDCLESVVEPDEEQNLDYLVKQLVAEASLSDMSFEKKMNSTEHNYENLGYEDKNSLDLSEYVDSCDLHNSSSESTTSRRSSWDNELPTFSNSLGHVTKGLGMNYFCPARNQSNSIKIEKKIRLNYRRPQNGFVANANYFNFGTLC